MIEIYALANVVDYDNFTKAEHKKLGIKTPKPTIIIYKSDSKWKQAFKKYIKGEKPTDSSEWDRGVFAWFRPVKGKRK